MTTQPPETNGGRRGDSAGANCLTESDLRSFHAGELDDEDAGRIRAHLSECPRCADRDARRRAEHESWIDMLRAAGRPSGDERPVGGERADGSSAGVIAGYDLAEEIARGGQGIVYRAVQKSTRREVALKVLREGPWASRGARRRFEREIELIAGLRHPNIVAVFDSGVTADGRQYAAMDYVRGNRLDQYVRDRRLDMRGRLALFAQVCDAVDYAHQRGVIHRDLKPSNILVDEQGEPRILDFGLARQTADAGGTIVTATEMVAGTLPYLSPEQARGRPDEIDIRSDVYALGVVLYELLTERFPYPVEGDVSTVLRHVIETAPMRPDRAREARRGSDGGPCGVSETVGEEVETIVLKALAKERERRYQTAGELARDIRRWLAGEAVEAKRDSRWYVLKKTVQRHRVAVAATGAIFAVVLVSAVALLVMYRRQGALLAEVQRQKDAAESAEASASRRFTELRKLANTFIFDFDTMIADLAGALKARELLVKTGLEYLNSLAADLPPDDPDMLNELGVAYFRLGSIQDDRNRENLHDPEAALDSYRRGLAMIEALHRLLPNELKPGRDLWNGYHRVAAVYDMLGQRDASLEYFQKARALNESLLAAYPDNADLKREHVFDLRFLAERWKLDGETDRANALFAEAAETTEILLQEQPANVMLRHDLASIYSWQADICEWRGNWNRGLELRRKSVTLLEKLADETPASSRFQSDYATGLDRLAGVLQKLGRNQEAMQGSIRSLDVTRRLAELEPNNLHANTTLRAAYCRLGEQAMALGRLAEAAAYFDEYESVSAAALERFGDQAPIRRDRAVSYYKRYELEKKRADQADSHAEARLSHLRDARASLQGCLREFERMRETGKLGTGDRDVPDELAGELRDLDVAIEELQPAGTAASQPSDVR